MKEKKKMEVDTPLHPNFLRRKNEPYGAVFIMNSKIHLRKNNSNEYFKTISHYFRVYSLSGFK